MDLHILGLPVAVGARHGLVDNRRVPVLRVEHDTGHVLEVQATVGSRDLADHHGRPTLQRRALGLLNLPLSRGLAVTAANEEHVVALGASHGGDVVHLELEMAEDQRGLL